MSVGLSGTSFRMDETYIKVGRSCRYLSRAVDMEGQTIEFMLSAERDVEGIEALNMMRKGRAKSLDKDNVVGQAKFVESLFGVAA